MSIYEYNEEYVRKAFYEEGKENGYEEGKAEGKGGSTTKQNRIRQDRKSPPMLK